MLTYTGQRNFFATKVNNPTDTATLTLADQLINDQRRQLLSSKLWWFLEKAFTMTTVAATQFTNTPGDLDRILSSPYVTVGTVRYTPRECPNREMWDQLNLVSYNSDIPEWWYGYAGQIGLFPVPSAGGYTMTVNGKQKVIDLSLTDYTTGTIVSVAAAGTAVVGSGTTWTAGMVGMWLQITQSASANKGDGQWYQISAVGSNTTLTLSRPYGGVAVAAGAAAYTIGQMSILPDAYDSLPIYKSLVEYFTSIDPNSEKAGLYSGMAKDLQSQMNADQSNRTGGRVLDEGIDKTSIINPNLTVGF